MDGRGERLDGPPQLLDLGSQELRVLGLVASSRSLIAELMDSLCELREVLLHAVDALPFEVLCQYLPSVLASGPAEVLGLGFEAGFELSGELE